MNLTICKLNNLLQKWYLPLIIGILFLMVAAIIYSVPSLSLTFILTMFSLTIISFGIRETLFFYSNKAFIQSWFFYIIGSFMMILLGFFMLLNPSLTLQTIGSVIAIIFILKSIQNILFLYTFSHRTESSMGQSWIYSLALIFFAIVILFFPKLVSTTLVIISGLLFIIIGVICIIFSMILRKSQQKLKEFKASFRNKTQDAVYEIID